MILRNTLALLAASAFAAAGDPADDTSWPSFRGHNARGVAEGHSTSVEWDVAGGTNVAWKTSIPGLSHSSPVVWGERVFVTTAIRVDGESELKVGLYGSPVPAGEEGLHKFQVYCLDRRNGDVIWVRTSIEAVPRMQRHPKGSHAASSPTTDGERVVACFASEGLYCYDMDGQLLWSRDLGELDSGWYMAKGAQFGFASSPILHAGIVLLQVDVQENSALVALDATDGTDVWRTPRADVPTWSSPTVDVEGGRSQVIVNGYKHMGGYDLASGDELWKLAGGGDVPVPTPIVHDGMIFITNGHGRWNPIYGIDANVRGEIEDGFSPETEDFLVWSQPRKGTYMQTPLVYGDYLFACTDAGILTCYDPRTGHNLNRLRLGAGQTGFTASPVAADGKLYFTSEEGEVHVIEASPDLTELAVNPLGETCLATPAISAGTLFFRTRGHVVAVSGNAPVELVDTALASTDEQPAAEPVPAGASAAEPAAVDLPDSADLFAQHVAARGGLSAIEKHRTMQTTGRFGMPAIGLEGPMITKRGSPNLLYTSVDMGAMGETLQGFDGETGWIMSPQVGNEILTGDLLESVKKEADWLGDARGAARYESTRTTGREDFHGFDCWVVEAQTKRASTVKLYFDARSGLIRGSDSTEATAGGPMRLVNVVKTYAEFDGVRIPTETEILIPEHHMSQVVLVDEVEFDTLDDDAFALPPEIAEKLGK